VINDIWKRKIREVSPKKEVVNGRREETLTEKIFNQQKGGFER